MKKTKTILKNIASIILFLSLLTIFTIDRMILLFLPHVPSKPIQDIYMNMDKMTPVFQRVTTILIIIGLYKLIETFVF